MRFAAVCLAVLAIAACKKPASLEFTPAKAVVITNDKGAPIPTVVVKDADGNPIEDAKPVLKLDSDIATLDEKLNKLIPVKNGSGKLTATLEELPPAAVDVKVQIIDELNITCADPCG